MNLLIGMLSGLALVLAAIPTLLTIVNLRLFVRAPQPRSSAPLPQVSVLVPARNEAIGIERMARAILASESVELELIVLDDNSQDATTAIVSQLANQDARVRLLPGKMLVPGWCGKQHACAQLAAAARHNTWVFIDADVLLKPDAIARSLAFLEQSKAGLVSGFPLQLTSSFGDWLLLPLIHFVLLGFLPLAQSRRHNSPSMAAGCGQLFITHRDAYLQAGGHAGIRASLHDGIKLPRAYRCAKIRTDIFDASDIATCRMYTCDLDVLKGLAKNATEGIGSPTTILPFTLLLFGGQLLPLTLVVWGLFAGWQGWPQWAIAVACLAVVCSLLPRFLEAIRYGQSLGSAVMHPLGIAVLLSIQWFSLLRRLLGFQARWKGRSLTPQ